MPANQPMKHWKIHYYFTVGGRKREYKGTICECFHAATREDAVKLAGVCQIDMQAGHTLSRVVAVPQTSRGLCDFGLGEVPSHAS